MGNQIDVYEYMYIYVRIDLFEIKSGVHQGCALSPTISNYAICWIMISLVEVYAN